MDYSLTNAQQEAFKHAAGMSIHHFAVGIGGLLAGLLIAWFAAVVLGSFKPNALDDTPKGIQIILNEVGVALLIVFIVGAGLLYYI